MRRGRDDEIGRTTATTQEEKRNTKKRKPLADLTNVSSSSSPSFPRPVPLILRKEPRPNPKPAKVPRERSALGVDGAPDAPASPPKVNESISGVDCVNYQKTENALVCTLKGTKSKGKEHCLASSCPPVEKSRSCKEKHIDDEETDRRKALSVPYQKPRKRCKSKAIKILPQEFIGRQKAYFAEIDAFELPEEVVSESELE